MPCIEKYIVFPWLGKRRLQPHATSFHDWRDSPLQVHAGNAGSTLGVAPFGLFIRSVSSYLNTAWRSAGVPLCKSLPVEHRWTCTTKFDQTWSPDSARMSRSWLTMWCLCDWDLLTVHWWKQCPPCRAGIVREGPVQPYRARYSKLNVSRKNTVTVCSISLEQGFSQHNWHFRANIYLLLEAILYHAWSLRVSLAWPRDSFWLYHAPTVVSTKKKKGSRPY